jgi:adenylate cyclase
MRSVSIRASLLASIGSLVIVMSLVILAVTFFSARQAVRDLSSRLIGQAADQTEVQLTQFFSSLQDVVRASAAWWDGGLVAYEAAEDVEGLNALFVPVLDAYRQVTSMMLVQDTGFEYLLFRDLRGGEDYTWYNRIVEADVGPDAGFEVRFTEDLQEHSSGPLPEDARDYDPRKRPFYLKPEIGEITWTSPYYFFITKDAGMTVSYKWRDPASGRTRLVAYDLLLMDLSKFTASLRPTENGKAFVMLSDGSLLGVPADSRWPDDTTVRAALRNPEERTGGTTEVDRDARLMTAEDHELPVVADAVRAWKANEDDERSLFRYTSEGAAWWGGFHPFPLGDQVLWIGVVVPEADFLSGITRQRNVLVAVSAIALLIAVLMAGVLARRFSKPLELLAAQTARVRDLELTEERPVQTPLREVQLLADANAQMMKALDSFSRYVPMDVVRELLRRGEVARIGGSTRTLSILFTDIEGFTSLAEHTEPEQLTAHMAEYFSAMLEVLAEEQATVDKFIGDAIVAFWGAPSPNVLHARHATRAVLRAVSRLEEMNAAWDAEGMPALKTRFGLHCGEAVVGNVGAPERLNYTVLGDAVNLASRLESVNRYYGTYALATAALVEAAGEGFVWRHVDRISVKGREEPVDIYEPIGMAEDVRAARLDQIRAYEAALARYIDGQFGAAAERLEALLAERPGDVLCTRLLELANANMRMPPVDWEGVNRLDEK